MKGVRLALLLSAWLLCQRAVAHKPSDSYLRIYGGGERLTAEWDIALKDLEFLIGMDADQNSEITWGELKSQREAIEAHALSRLRIEADGRECDLQATDLLVTQHSDGGYAVLAIQTDCPGDAALLRIQYNLLFDVDPTHRGLVFFEGGGVSSTYVLTPDEPALELRTGESRLWASFREFVREGVWHIWIGLDHVLFLLTLLLPSVLVLQTDRRHWQPVESFRPALASVLRIVTVFTVAHSITLWLAVMQYVTLPGWLVESTIAFSIIVTAVHNLYPVLPLAPWKIAFVFGLVHGFGFANVLVDLGLSKQALAVSLLGFNVGVELGQIAIVLVFLPIAFLIRGTWFYRWIVLRCGSVVVAAIAAIWMVERLFNTTILGI